jgi:TrpR family trp operon transcriptional repressor
MSTNPYHSLLTHLANCNDSAAIELLFSALLTDKEQQEIANRIRIFDLLERGVTQREISEQLGVGIATVSRGAKAMQVHDVSALLKTHRENTSITSTSIKDA